jgi:hypothetical protein
MKKEKILKVNEFGVILETVLVVGDAEGFMSNDTTRVTFATKLNKELRRIADGNARICDIKYSTYRDGGIVHSALIIYQPLDC